MHIVYCVVWIEVDVAREEKSAFLDSYSMH